MADFSKPIMALFDNLIADDFKKGDDIMFIMVSSSRFQVATQSSGRRFRGSIGLRRDVLIVNITKEWS
jgi:hypothetical protein